jgi:hypothetical protein
MKLNELKGLHDKFDVDGLHFRLEDATIDMDGDSVEFSVTDRGGLQIGRFFVDVDDGGACTFKPHPDHPTTLDKINYRNDTARISNHVKKAIDSVRT